MSDRLHKGTHQLTERYLIISDLQIPFEHPKALDFCKAVQKDCRIPKTNILCVGDELDQYFASRYPKDPDADLSPRSEIRAAREKLKPWISAFPLMRICTSNHGLRWVAKAVDCYIPNEIIRPYKEIFDMPQGWQFKDEWVIKDGKHPFRMIHGVGYSGIMGARNAAIDGRISTVIGHLHSHAGINYIVNDKAYLWGMNVGCLIGESFAFKYAKYSRFKAMLSVGVILNGGSTPMLVPYA